MTAARRLAAILAADIVGYSRLMGEDETGTARAVSERREAARPIVADLGGRVVKTTGDGLLLEFSSVVAAVECAIAIQKLMAERNAGTPEDKRILYRIGVNLGDVLVEGDDILGDGVNIAARLESICEPGGIFVSGAAYDHVVGRVDAAFADLGEQALKNILRPVRAYALGPGSDPTASAPAAPRKQEPPRLSIIVLSFRQYRRRSGTGIFRRRRHREPDHRSVASERLARDRAEHRIHLQRQGFRRNDDRARVERSLRARGTRPARRRPDARQCPAHRRAERASVR